MIDKTYGARAAQMFLHPSIQYPWVKIVSGVMVRGSKKMMAVDFNTFRGFHRIDKDRPGAKGVFIRYFVDEQKPLLDGLSNASSRDDLHNLCNRVCRDLLPLLDNVSPKQLASYNKLRHPVDLYVEKLVSMATELESVRPKLVPMLFLPLDSQIFAHQALFTEHELSTHHLSRRSSYKDVGDEGTYVSLQALITNKASTLESEHAAPFYPIYFDLLWNKSREGSGANLFETNPGA